MELLLIFRKDDPIVMYLDNLRFYTVKINLVSKPSKFFTYYIEQRKNMIKGRSSPGFAFKL